MPCSTVADHVYDPPAGPGDMRGQRQEYMIGRAHHNAHPWGPRPSLSGLKQSPVCGVGPVLAYHAAPTRWCVEHPVHRTRTRSGHNHKIIRTDNAAGRIGR